MKRLGRSDVVLLSRMVVALAESDSSKAADIIHEAGYVTKNMDRALAARYARVMIDANDRKYTGGKHVQIFLEEVRKRPEKNAALPKIYVVQR